MRDTDRYAYPLDLTPEPEGGFTVIVPDLPGTVTYGETREKALDMASDAIDVMIGAIMDAHQDIPEPSPARGRPMAAPPALTAAKAALYAAMREGGITETALAERLGIAEREVRRMLDPCHATKIGRIEDALALLGRRIVVEIHSAS